MTFRTGFLVGLLALMLSGCSNGESSMEVTATAYTSTPGETDSTPSLAAWGDTLKPGMKSIAVSRDLIAAGLTHNTKVRIEGLEGEYRVLDKMNQRWVKKIDIYMGEDRNKALQWGKRKVTIYWIKDE
ncbi:3D domain-containing protein [Aliamphritea spongicola]|uniref:3D domain-containing protein n=1 Tax=Aliamphritea spongicola TaxID=707589 RepID=UPI001FAF25FC|nr:3D domain-containing protein [Aliamphritea spongicola]